MAGKADLIIRSDYIFTGRSSDKVIDGFIAVNGSRIQYVGSGNNYREYTGEHTELLDMTGKVVTPGFVDNHVFFMGYMWERVGMDASMIHNQKELFHGLKSYERLLDESAPLLAHGLPDEMEVDCKVIEENFPKRPVVIFRESRESCCMNPPAKERYGFDEDNCYAEACYGMFKELVGDKKYAREKYMQFQKMLARQGVTSIKEIGFDDYYGFTDVLKELEDEKRLIQRVNLVSQPVGREADLNYGEKMREIFQGDFVRFMGYNLMVDGDIEAYEGDIFDAYPDLERAETYEEPDYKALKETVLRADRQGFRCALHAEGDRAVSEAINIIEECRKENGERDARHAIVDMELITGKDIQRLADNGITAINYAQIMSCYPEYKDYYGLTYFSKDRQKTIWPYRSLLDAEVNLCWGTDLPLDIPDIPLSIYYATERKFPDGEPGEGYNMPEAVTPAEVLQGWTYNGQKANFEENRLGTLETGKLADIAVLDRNVFEVCGNDLKETKVCMTICDGKIVYRE